MEHSKFARRITKSLAVVFLLVGQFTFGTSEKVHATPSVFGGTFVPAVALLGDTGCAMSAGGPIRCSSARYSDSITSDMGPLAGKTIIDLSGDSYTACAISGTYDAYCWGDNSSAAVGDNTTTDRSVPTAVYKGGALSGVSLKKVAANSYGACAISTVGRLYCWGQSKPSGGGGIYDRFYTGESYSTQLIPPKAVSDAQLTSLTWADVEAIDNDYICAMSTTRVFKCFGGSITTYTTSAIPSGETIVSMSAAQQYGDLHACALSNLGKVYCNGAYYFRPASSAPNSSNFAQVVLETAATSVRVADGIACAVLSNGGVSCWGYGLQRSTGLGLTGYPVVNVLPSGSNVGEAAPLMSYGSYPLIVVRTSSGQILEYQFTSNNTGALFPSAIDNSLKTPRVSVDAVSVVKPGSYSSCNASFNQACVSLEGSLDELSYTAINYAIYSDSSAQFLESLGTAQFQYRNVALGTVYALSDHWVTLTVTGPYGTTTTSPILIPRQSAEPISSYSSSSSSKTVTSYPVQLKSKVKKFSRYSLNTVFRIRSTGKQTWTVSRGCFIKGGYLYTGNAYYCSVKLKVASTKKYRATTDWFTIYLR